MLIPYPIMTAGRYPFFEWPRQWRRAQEWEHDQSAKLGLGTIRLWTLGWRRMDNRISVTVFFFLQSTRFSSPGNLWRLMHAKDRICSNNHQQRIYQAYCLYDDHKIILSKNTSKSYSVFTMLVKLRVPWTTSSDQATEKSLRSVNIK